MTKNCPKQFINIASFNPYKLVTIISLLYKETGAHNDFINLSTAPQLMNGEAGIPI